MCAALVISSCLFSHPVMAAIVSLDFDQFTLVSGNTTSVGTYVGDWTDVDTNIKVRVTMTALSGTGGASFTYNESESSGVPQVPPTNVSLGIDDVNGTGNTFFTRYRFDFLDPTTNALLAPADYRITVYDIDLRNGVRTESVLFPDTLVMNAQRFGLDGFPTNNVYAGPPVDDPDVNNTDDDATFVAQLDGGIFDGTDFTKFQGLANFDTNEDVDNAAAQGAVSLMLTNLNSFEMITMIEDVPSNLNPGARFVVDFSNPPDSASIVPEPSAGFLFAFLGAALIIFRQRRQLG